MLYRTKGIYLALAFSVIFITTQRPAAQQQPTISEQQREAVEKYIREAKAHQTPQARKDAQEMANFRLSMNELTKSSKAQQSLHALEEQHPELKELSEAQERDNQNNSEQTHEKTIDESVRLLEKHPEAVSAIRNAGMTPREFILTIYTMMTNSFALAYKQMGVKELFPGASEENMAFIQAHQQDVKKLATRDETKQSEPEDH